MEQELICQSCGMPMRRDEDFGTNTNGSKNEEYCHFCFQEGKFTEPDITMEQKIEKVVHIATSQMNMSEAQARAMANNIIPNLKRWESK
jgi:hypothetical protein